MTVVAPSRSRAQVEMSRRAAERAHARRRFIFLAVCYGILCLASVVAIFPFLYLISLSFKQSTSLVTYPPQWIPDPPYFGNYTTLLFEKPFPRWALNSLIVASVVTVIKLLIDSMAGYAFAKMDFPFKEPIFVIVLATLMIPLVATLIPTFLIVRGLGLVNTYPGLILPGLASPIGIFLMRQFMEQLPNDLENAARLDGSPEPYIFARIILPLCKPALVMLAIFTFMTQWFSFVWPLVVTTTDDMRLLTNGLSTMKGQWTVNWGLVAAGMVLIIIPTALAFVAFMRQFIAGSLAGALKQ